jgi:predicted nucleotidyltransferase
MSDKSRRLVDGEGVNRVCDAMISMVSDRDQYKLILNKELAKIINSISKNYNPEKVILFGSLSGNTIKETSDIDLVVIKQTDKDPWTRMEEVDAYIDHTFPVDVLVYTPDEIRNRLEINDCFVKDILAEGKVLYERTI